MEEEEEPPPAEKVKLINLVQEDKSLGSFIGHE